MSQKKLRDEIERLKNELKKQINIIKEKDDQIAVLKEQRFQIRDLVSKIGKLCDPTITRVAIDAATPEWAESYGKIEKRPTAGTPIYVASNILEPASPATSLSIGEDNYSFKYTKRVGDVRPCHSDKQKLKGAKSISINANNSTEKPWHEKHPLYPTQRKSREQNKISKVTSGERLLSRNSDESKLTGNDSRDDSPEPVTLQSLLDSPGANKDDRNMMSEQARSSSRGRPTMKKKKSLPAKWSEEDARSSEEIILLSHGVGYRSSTTAPMALDKTGLKLSLMSNVDSLPSVVNVQPRSMSDRSLSSLAEVLPSLPSENSFFPLNHMKRESSRDTKPKHWGV